MTTITPHSYVQYCIEILRYAPRKIKLIPKKMLHTRRGLYEAQIWQISLVNSHFPSSVRIERKGPICSPLYTQQSSASARLPGAAAKGLSDPAVTDGRSPFNEFVTFHNEEDVFLQQTLLILKCQPLYYIHLKGNSMSIFFLLTTFTNFLQFQ